MVIWVKKDEGVFLLGMLVVELGMGLIDR